MNVATPRENTLLSYYFPGLALLACRSQHSQLPAGPAWEVTRHWARIQDGPKQTPPSVFVAGATVKAKRPCLSLGQGPAGCTQCLTTWSSEDGGSKATF